MTGYATGKDAWGICDQSGLRVRYRDMKTQWDGLKVHPDWYEEKHPQLEAPNYEGDKIALKDPRPDVAETTSGITQITSIYPDTAGGNGP